MAPIRHTGYSSLGYPSANFRHPPSTVARKEVDKYFTSTYLRLTWLAFSAPLFRSFWVLGLLRDSLAGPCPLVGRLHCQYFAARARPLATVCPSSCSQLYGSLPPSSSYEGRFAHAPACLLVSVALVACLSVRMYPHASYLCL